MKSPITRRDFIKLTAMGGMAMGLPGYTGPGAPAGSTKETKVGIIGLDTSHSIAFTKALNDPDVASDLAGFTVVAAYPKGSLDIQSSVSRIPKYIKQMKNMDVAITGSVDELLDKVDVVLLETNDGRRHLEQARKVFKAGKPVFIDKPIAASLADVLAIFEVAKTYNVPVFSASSLRYMKGAQAIRHGKVGDVLGAEAYSPAAIEPTHPDLYWYGIHGVEALFTVMGAGCTSVRRVHTDDTDVVVGTWADGRIGTFRGRRSGKHDYGGIAFGSDGEASLGPYGGYRPLLVQIITFFRTGTPPVDPEETTQIYGFMSAADESKRRGGASVALGDIMAQARQ